MYGIGAQEDVEGSSNRDKGDLRAESTTRIRQRRTFTGLLIYISACVFGEVEKGPTSSLLHDRRTSQGPRGVRGSFIVRP